jgi:FHA domain
MPEESRTRQITGDDIISELIRNVDVGAFKVRYTVLVPCVFNVYLHPEDYELIRPISDFIRKEARQALADHLAELNKVPSRPAFARWLGGKDCKSPEHKILERDWSIEFHRDEEERLRPGDIEIYSDLGTGQQAELGAGAMTTFITRRPSEAAAPAETSVPADRQVYAVLRYSEAAGERTFPMTREQIVIGRGGKAVWVDLKLDGPADISREHCRIRRDASGQFYLKDLSQYGTAINGNPVPSSVERNAAGDKVDRNVEVPLPARASITLAEVFTLDFEAK